MAAAIAELRSQLADVLAEVRQVRRLSAALFRKRDAAGYLGWGLTRFAQGVADGTLPRPVKTPAGPRWRRSDLDAYVGRLKPGRPTRKPEAA